MKTNKGGRPRKEIDFELIDILCEIQCTGEEIAHALGVDYDTLNRNIKERYRVGFSEYFKQKKGSGKSSLRRKQWEVAMAGNPVMLIWLGKNILDQTDKQEIKGNLNISSWDSLEKAIAKEKENGD